MKKYLALFINNLRRFNSILTTDRFLFQKICENFENLKLFYFTRIWIF